MAKNTYLDDLIGYKHRVIYDLASSPDVVGLLLDKPKVDMDSDAAYEVVGNNIYDFDYVDRSIQRNDAYIMVEAEMANPTSGSMARWWLYVQIVCAKEYNPLDAKKFKGVVGNRRDNLAKQVDLIINGRDDLGIGHIELANAGPATVPDTFTSIMLTYEIHDFRHERLGERVKMR